MSTRSVVRSALLLLDRREKKRLIVAIALQFLVNLADVIGVALVGAIGSLGVTYLAGVETPNWVNILLSLMGLEGNSTQEAIMLVAGFAGLLFIAKSILTLFLMKRIFTFLANRQARVSIELAEKLTRVPFHWLKRQSSDRLVYATTDGTSALFVGVVGNLISVIVDITLLVMIFVIVIVINPVMAISTILFFGALTYILHRSIQNYSSNLGRVFQYSSIQGRESLATLFVGYREIFTLKKSGFFLDAFKRSRIDNTVSNANAMWLQYIPKATAEIGLVVGAGGLVIFQTWQNSASGGLGMILLFLASASRLTPALMRIQGSLLYMKNYAASASSTLNLLDEISQLELMKQVPKENSKNVRGLPVEINLLDVSYRFLDSTQDVLKSVSLAIKAGSIVALAGPSGSGKTTLADLIIGIHTPSQGKILYRDSSSVEWQDAYDLRIAYVPQNPFVIPGNLIENIAVGVEKSHVDYQLLESAIKSSHLQEVLDNLPEGLETNLAGIGSRISGGEKQRIALARAFYSQPNLLVIDEGTSALDGASEKIVTDFLLSLAGSVTVILIAHRLPSIKGADIIYFLESGVIQGSGNFTELQQQLPQFAEQVKLMQLPQVT
jgi:ABC-type multidrug transport system fused ATPase/permease subunit